jgi:putative membrane protein
VIAVWYMHGTGWGWWVLMSLGMIAFWVAIIYLVLWLLRGTPRRPREPQEPPADDSALEVLQRRLAAGEISGEEFEEIRKLLDGQRREPVGAAGRPGGT